MEGKVQEEIEFPNLARTHARDNSVMMTLWDFYLLYYVLLISNISTVNFFSGKQNLAKN